MSNSHHERRLAGPCTRERVDSGESENAATLKFTMSAAPPEIEVAAAEVEVSLGESVLVLVVVVPRSILAKIIILLLVIIIVCVLVFDTSR
jgi:hypothetical protein